VIVAVVLVGVALVAERFVPPLIGAVRVADGDSIEVGGERVRLAGIDAPELHQSCGEQGREWPCGQQARAALQKLVDEGEARGNAQEGGEGGVSCRPVDEDRYGRSVAVCSLDGRDLGAAMVQQGWAVATDGYGSEEREARAAGRGIWAGPFERPADWRARHPRAGD